MIVSQPVSGAVGSVVEAWDADLDAVAAVATTSTGRSLLAIANGAAGRTILGAISAVATSADIRTPVPLSCFAAQTAAVWTLSSQGSGIIRLRRTASAATERITFDCSPVIQRTTASKGWAPSSVTIQYKVSTGAINDLTATLSTVVMPANASAVASGSAVTFTYDASHDTTAERLTVAEHTMVLTITTPAYLNAGEHLVLDLLVDGTATGVVDLKLIDIAGSWVPVDATA